MSNCMRPKCGKANIDAPGGRPEGCECRPDGATAVEAFSRRMPAFRQARQYLLPALVLCRSVRPAQDEREKDKGGKETCRP